MSLSLSQVPVLLAEQSSLTRSLIGDVLRGFNADCIHCACDGEQLLKLAAMHRPRIVITRSRLPKISGLEFTRLVRAGHGQIDRALPIIVTTNTPTAEFLREAQTAGVDEMLAVPFTPQALRDRLAAVLNRQRKFVETEVYTGPDRRRRAKTEGAAPRRRQADFTAALAPWESDRGRELMLRQIERFAASLQALRPNDSYSHQAVLDAINGVRLLAEALEDEMTTLAAKAMARYVAMGALNAGGHDKILQVHLSAMQTLAKLGNADMAQRREVAEGCATIVERALLKEAAGGRGATVMDSL